ncbi:MAG: glycine cleavage system protein H [Anaeromyxobacter sp.]
MQAVIDILQATAVFVLGVGARFGVVLLALLAVGLPVAAVAAVIRAAAARREARLGLREVAGVPFRPALHLAPGHVWLRARGGGTVELGLDGIAQQLLPGVTAVEPVATGTRVEAGEPVALLHAGERSVPLLAPVAGVVAGVNAAVLRDPALVKRDGLAGGWVAALTPAGDGWLGLPTGDVAEAFTRRESLRFASFLEERLGLAAADGGALVAPAPWLMGEDGWRKLVDSFLRPA